MINQIEGKITNIKYKPLLCSPIPEYNISNLENAMSNSASFVLRVNDKNRIAVSWWVSAKRTRSYPYSRVYNTLNFSGKRITIIPIFKDEGLDGDRDFLQFDTIALMSLLNVHVIIAYYATAIKSKNYVNKITSQRFDNGFISQKINELISNQQSDALHWNMEELTNISEVGRHAIDSYINISRKLNVKMSNFERAEERIYEISKSREHFLSLSRNNAERAQLRESLTTQPKEIVDGTKGIITIKNYLGGEYYFTVDETMLISDDVLHLIEAKHCKSENKLPSKDDIKDGLIKMILYTNLEDVTCNKKNVTTVPSLKLTNANSRFSLLRKSEIETFELLKKESEINKFNIITG